MLRRGCAVGACCIIFAVICSILQVGGVPFGDFFPFGLIAGDQSLPPSDDEYRQVALITPFPFAGRSTTELYVRITSSYICACVWKPFGDFLCRWHELGTCGGCCQIYYCTHSLVATEPEMVRSVVWNKTCNGDLTLTTPLAVTISLCCCMMYRPWVISPPLWLGLP